MEYIKVKLKVLIFFLFLLIFWGTVPIKGVYADWRELEYYCEDGYTLIGINKYCCPSAHIFEVDGCYKIPLGSHWWTIYGKDVRGVSPDTNVISGQYCCYDVEYSEGHYGPVKSKENILGSKPSNCETAGGSPKEKQLCVIEDGFRKNADSRLEDCGPRAIADMKPGSGGEERPYCYEVGEPHPTKGITGCCPDGDWSTLGFHDTFCACTSGTPPGSPTTVDDTAPLITCKDLCMGEGYYVDHDDDPTTPEVFKKGEQYSNCCMCVCDQTECTDDFEETIRWKTGNIWTELGCINASEKGFVISMMRIFVGAVTGIALIRFIQAGIMLNTDDPEKIKEGKSIFISAVVAIFMSGLMPILLNFLGLDILGIGKLFSFI